MRHHRVWRTTASAKSACGWSHRWSRHGCERALAAERNVRLGKTARRINWTLTPERIFVWLRLAEAGDRDVSEVDRARRRAKLGRARLHLHLLQSKQTFAWRVRRAHRTVIRQAMQAAEHIGLADFPDAANEREAMQMYMATIYGFVDATSPQAVAHLNAWQRDTDSADLTVPVAALDTNDARLDMTTSTTRRVNAAPALAPAALTSQTPRDADDDGHVSTGAGASGLAAPQTDDHREPLGRRALDLANFGQRLDLDGLTFKAGGPPTAQRNDTDAPDNDVLDDDEATGDDDRPDDEADVTAVAAMRRFWDREVAGGRVPTGAELSRAAGVPPATGLGRRKRREWEAELPDYLKTAANVGR